MLAPLLLTLAMVRREGAQARGVGKSALEALPRFVLGYIGFAVLRTVLDRVFPGAAWVAAMVTVDRFLVDLLMATVSAAIGLHLELRTLLRSGWRSLLVGGGASIVMAALSLAMIAAAARGSPSTAALIGLVTTGITFGFYRSATSARTEERGLKERLARGAPLSLSEAIRVLGIFERDGELGEENLRRVLAVLHPAIGELIPVRESPLPHGEGCRWVTYWEGRTGWALVAVCREAGSSTPIHAHPHRLLGKSIEGRIEELRFEERGKELELVTRDLLAHNDIWETDGLATLHLVRAVGDKEAIDLQLRGPEVGEPGRRFRTKADVLSLPIGARFDASPEIDDRPGQAGEGAGAGRLPNVSINA
jgi:hypothetical protein